MRKTDEHIFKGMSRDSSISKQGAEFLWDAHNIRLTARNGETQLSITNEVGTTQVVTGNSDNDYLTIRGNYVGHCVLNDKLVVFTAKEDYIDEGEGAYTPGNIGDGSQEVNEIKNNNEWKKVSQASDRIYLITYDSYSNNWEVRLLYAGNLNFNVNYPLETLGIYEADNIQKVYWTDGVNQPRIININKDRSKYNDLSFDFVQELELNETISVYKEASSSGQFPSGVVQYVFTYYNKNGQESNIFRATPLYYTCFNTRAGSPEEKIGNAFRIAIMDWDINFDYIRVYSIVRTSLNATPECRRVTDIKLPRTKHDTSLVGGEKINASCLIIEEASGSNGEYYPDYVESQENCGYIAERNTTECKPGLGGAYGIYWVFKKSENPNLVLKLKSHPDKIDRYITWGQAETIYVSKDMINGQGEAITWFRVLADNDMLIGTSIGTVSIDQLVVVDNGTMGDTIDPQELNYLGGEVVSATTMCQKDGTLFLGNINIKRPMISSEIKTLIENRATTEDKKNTYANRTVECSKRQVILPASMDSKYYTWGNSLNSYNVNDSQKSIRRLVPSMGFKCGEHYRLGVQFQYKTGKWSDPVWVNDVIETEHPVLSGFKLNIPVFTATLESNIVEKVLELGYLRARPVVVFPTAQDRLIQAQGVLNATVYGIGQNENHTPDYQSSWFFRPVTNCTPANSFANFQHNFTLYGHDSLNSEIQGVHGVWNHVSNSSSTLPTKARVSWDDTNGDAVAEVDTSSMTNIFAVNQNVATFHSPDIEFDDTFATSDLSSYRCKLVGKTKQIAVLGDINIETSSPTIKASAGGFQHQSLSSAMTETDKTSTTLGSFQSRLMAGFFYNDYLVEDYTGEPWKPWGRQTADSQFMVYPWQRGGSLNNDATRGSDTCGTQSAILKEKKISNLLYFSGDVSWNTSETEICSISNAIQLFDTDQSQMLKIPYRTTNAETGTNIYYGNIDQLLSPVVPYGSIAYYTGKGLYMNIAFGSISKDVSELLIETMRDGVCRMSMNGVYWFNAASGTNTDQTTYLLDKKSDIGNESGDTLTSKSMIRMKYKSTPHAVIQLNAGMTTYQVGGSNGLSSYGDNDRSLYLTIGEIFRKSVDMTKTRSETDFGGITEQSLQANSWYPAGEIVRMTRDADGNAQQLDLEWSYGDTWYQRYDCLKTYAYTEDDENQVVEIGSFMLETHVNIDGRYDRNRGAQDNTNMSPTNFNLINKVYSQMDNFFTYRIMTDDYYNQTAYPNVITWSNEKTNGSDVDPWTAVTLASTMDIDGTKGKVQVLKTYKDNFYCFQDKCISTIQFNSRVQVSVSDGVPIEIANSGKMDGARAITTNIGCYNKFAIAESPNGLYFVDSTGNTLYSLNGIELNNISDLHGFGYWFSEQDTVNSWIPKYAFQWTTESVHNYKNNVGIRLFYDDYNSDLYIVTPTTALCYNELLGQFVSFFDYPSIFALVCFNKGVYMLNWKTDTEDDSYPKKIHLWEMGTLKENGLQVFNKFFGSTEIQPDIENDLKDMRHDIVSDFTFVSNADMTLDKIFTNVETRVEKNVYITEKVVYDEEGNPVTNDNGVVQTKTVQNTGFFDRLRVWNEYQDTGEINLKTKRLYPSFHRKFRIYRMDIARAEGTRDRIRNTWCKVKLTMNSSDHNLPFEVHDVGVVYYT